VNPINYLISKKSHVIHVLSACFLMLNVSHVYAQQINLTVTGSNPAVPVVGYRWLIEEDVNQDVIPGETCQDGKYDGCMSLEFDKSHMPVIAKGTYDPSGVNTTPMPDLDPAKRYFISVLPDSASTDGGYSNGGTKISAGQVDVNVDVNILPFPTAQIRIFVFEDILPINNQPDAAEGGLAGFTFMLEDAGGRYGASGQQIANDVYGSPLGTTYNPDGSVLVMGDGTITTDANGVAIIKNLAPAKYGIIAIPPIGDPGWIQTSTIEGKKVIDAWVKPNEPAYFAEFGPPGPHVFIGFTKAMNNIPAVANGTVTTITGQVRSIHNSAPPNFAFHTGTAVPGCWVGLNDLSVGIGKGIFAAPCNDDSTFSIPAVPAGNYQLAVWDKNLDYIFATKNITVDAAGTCNNGRSCNLLDVPVYAWFGRLEQYVFHDANENGIWDTGESPMLEEGTAIRWRDGTIYQGFPTDLGGAAPYDEVFPFFSWLVAEVGFGRFKATGATMVTDAGGPVEVNGPYEGVLNPQLQTYVNDEGVLVTNSESRTKLGAVLTQGFQSFLGQTNQIYWGKTPYEIDPATGKWENGGISGMVFYAITRAENDPAYAAAELWEPGIPRIQVALYEDLNSDGVIDDQNGDGFIQHADVDNYPLGNFPGAEDYDYPDSTGVADGVYGQGDAIQVTHTDSWDDDVPTGCNKGFIPDPVVTHADGTTTGSGTEVGDCYDGLRNFNQIKDAVFDGGYAFEGIAAGTYIVATGEHPVYDTLKEEDRNVDFGNTFIQPNLLPAACVGELHLIPDTFTLFDSGEPVPNAGTRTPLCDLKQVLLSDGANAATDFFLFTDVPIAGHIVGFILDDNSNEFDANSPTFGEKYSPPYLPVSIKDWQGKEISRTYSDRWGKFNALVPSTYTVNVASSSGMSPNMLTACMNDPGPIKDVEGNDVIDPSYNPQYSQFCYTFNYMPGSTTYLDTPVVPVAAFTGPNQQALDCQIPTGSPVIKTATSTDGVPFVPTTGGKLTLTSPPVDLTGERDLTFGTTPGTVYLDGVAMATTWGVNGTVIVVEIPAGQLSDPTNPASPRLPYSGVLEVERSDGTRGVTGIKVHVGAPVYNGTAAGVAMIYEGNSIQTAINMANPGDLILVGPGTFDEMVIMSKPVMLQGSGAATVISALNDESNKLLGWRVLADNLAVNNEVSLLPGQELPGTLGNTTTLAVTEPALFFTEEGAGVFVVIKEGAEVVAKVKGVDVVVNYGIDGFGITGADHSGGIIVNGFAPGIEISNNRIFTNNGMYGGGIRIGHPTAGDGQNTDIKIHHNYVVQNGSLAATSSGGGISLYEGTDNYSVTNNYVCGNFSAGNGGGIGHLGLSNNGLIANNKIIFNQTFNQGATVSGGGIYVGGVPVLNALTAGSGSVVINANLIQGNQAGAGDGGGIRTALVNGTDVEDANGRRPEEDWYRIDITNNMIVNNMAGLAGGGISMQDTVLSFVTNNTVVNNNSTATAGDAFNPGNANLSIAQPAGIVSRAHSVQLMAAFNRFADPTLDKYSNPTMFNNIIMDNRSFYFTINTATDPATYGLVPAGVVDGANADGIYDLGVIGIVDTLTSGNSLLTGDATTAALFVSPYVNTDNGETIKQIETTTTIAAQPAFDEGGNFIHVRFGPLAPGGDYHLNTGTVASTNPSNDAVAPQFDIDGDTRTGVDIGADEAE